MLVPKVEKTDVQAFAKVWTYKGLSVPIDDTHIEFAYDMANIALRSFVEDCKAEVEKQASEEPMNLIGGGDVGS